MNSPELTAKAHAIDHIDLFIRLAETLNSSLELDDILKIVISEVVSATQAERGFVTLTEPVAGQQAFYSLHGIDPNLLEAPEFKTSRSLVEKVARLGEPVLTSDALTDARFSGTQSVMLLGLRSIACVPIKNKEKILGVIYVDNRIQAGIFTQKELNLLTAIAAHAGVALENARLYKETLEKARMDKELQLARSVQVGLLPTENPQTCCWDFASRWKPAREVGGDFYDFIPLANGQLGMLVADVTDKGIPAALFMAFTRSVVRVSVDDAISPVEGIRQANRLICTDSTFSLFITMFYAALDTDAHELTYVNAGHNPPLHYRSSEGTLTLLETTGMPLGIDALASYYERTIKVQPGDFIVFYTDGIPEAFDEKQEQFGMANLEETVMKNAQYSAADILGAIEQTVQEFSTGVPQSDDITILVAKRIQ